MLWTRPRRPGCCSTRCTTRSSRRGPRGRLRRWSSSARRWGRVVVPARPARVDRAGGRVRSVPRLRSVVSGDVHDPLRAAARGADGVSCRGGAASAAVRDRPGRGGGDCDVQRARRRHLDRGLRAPEGAGVPAARRHAATAARSAPAPPVLAMHRRQDLDLRRPIVWAGDAMPRDRAQAAGAAAARVARAGEVLERRRPRAGLVRRRSAAHRASTWSSTATPARDYRWPLPYPVLIGGVASERDGLAPHRSAGVVSRRRVGADAGGRGRLRT